MRDPFAGYDQWKTASPYDDEPDVAEEGTKCLSEIHEAFKNWEELSEYKKKAILESARDHLAAAIEYIDENC